MQRIWTGPDERGKLAPALLTLYEQVNVLVPHRATSSDGSIGDTAHASRKSDHNPNSDGIVCALDLTHDPKGGFDSYKFADFLKSKNDNRINYLISNGRIWNSGTSAWDAYHGTNPHNQHVHVSVEQRAERWNATQPWDLTGFTTEGNVESPTVLPRIHRGDTGTAVTVLQKALKIPADGIFGKDTEAAVKAFQAKVDLEPDGWVGPYTWSALGITALVSTAGKQFEHIIATKFGGKADPNYSAYDEKDFIDDNQLGCALPFRFTGKRPLVWIKGEASGVRLDNVPIVDVGPIYPSARGPADPYWETNSRPRAELNKVLSEAGIDVTPIVDSQLGLKGKGLVTWGFMSSEIIVPPVLVDAEAAWKAYQGTDEYKTIEENLHSVFMAGFKAAG